MGENKEKRLILMHMQHKKSTARDMTQGSIIKQLVLFALPLMLGNVFQMLYNTVDSVVVGNFVGTQALAAVGSTTMIVNIMVFFFQEHCTPSGQVAFTCKCGSSWSMRRRVSPALLYTGS